MRVQVSPPAQSNMKKVDILIADFLFVLHLIVVAIIMLGWLLPQIKILYLSLLIVWPLCWIVLMYCPLTKWEFDLRKKHNNDLEYRYEYLNYYIHKYFKVNIPVKRIFIYGLVFDISSLVIYLIFNL